MHTISCFQYVKDNRLKANHTTNRKTSLKHNPKPRQSVRIRSEREGAVVFLEDFADEDKANALAAALGRKEGAEQLRFRLFVDAFAGVGDF